MERTVYSAWRAWRRREQVRVHHSELEATDSRSTICLDALLASALSNVSPPLAFVEQIAENTILREYFFMLREPACDAEGRSQRRSYNLPGVVHLNLSGLHDDGIRTQNL